MLIVTLVCCVVAGLVLCETLVGRPLELDDGATCAEKRCRLSALEAATRAAPLLLAGLGLPLAVSHPLHGLASLAVAALLFGLGLACSRAARAARIKAAQE